MEKKEFYKNFRDTKKLFYITSVIAVLSTIAPIINLNLVGFTIFCNAMLVMALTKLRQYRLMEHLENW